MILRHIDRSGFVFLGMVLSAGVLIPALNLLVPPGSFFHVPDYLVPLLGKYLCFALLAISIDLIWGYAGILSLGHGAFFALGGYAMGMYLMRSIGDRGVYRNPLLPDVPTMTEAGIPLQTAVPYGLVAPAGTPREVVDTLNDALAEVLAESMLTAMLGDWPAQDRILSAARERLASWLEKGARLQPVEVARSHVQQDSARSRERQRSR